MSEITAEDVKVFHELVGNTGVMWLGKGRTLLRLAKGIRRVLIPHSALAEKFLNGGMAIDDFLVYGMLLGYAIECFLKGIWVANGGSLVIEGAYVKVPNTGPEHKLDRLATAVGVSVSDYERGLLATISEMASHRGRYPIPKRSGDLRFGTAESPVDEQKLFGTVKFDAAEALADRLASELQTLEDASQRQR